MLVYGTDPLRGELAPRLYAPHWQHVGTLGRPPKVSPAWVSPEADTERVQPHDARRGQRPRNPVAHASSMMLGLTVERESSLDL